MGSRVRCRKTIQNVFECYMVIEPPCENPVVKSVFPDNYDKPDIIKSAAQFAFPCPSSNGFKTIGTVEIFTFVLTDQDSKWTYGYCRHGSQSKSCILFLTFLPWQELFYKTLNHCAQLDDAQLVSFLDEMYTLPVPESEERFHVKNHNKFKPFICSSPSDLLLPSNLSENVSEFYNALGTESMLTLFTALLLERRIIIKSKKLSRLSSIVVACNLILFPMTWQHIFIPVLPHQLQDYLAAPMPFLIGVHLDIWDLLPTGLVDQVVIVDADLHTVTTPFPEDIESIPQDVVSYLRKNLAEKKVRLRGDGLARAFLRALTKIIGHYQDAIRDDGQTFDFKLFVKFAYPEHRKFIKTKFLTLQMFQEFVEEKLEKVRSGEVESDEFEIESFRCKSSRVNARTTMRKAGKAVLMTVARESGNIIDKSVKKTSAWKFKFRLTKESGKPITLKESITGSDIKSTVQLNLAHSSKHFSREDMNGQIVAITTDSHKSEHQHSVSIDELPLSISADVYKLSDEDKQVPNHRLLCRTNNSSNHLVPITPLVSPNLTGSKARVFKSQNEGSLKMKTL